MHAKTHARITAALNLRDQARALAIESGYLPVIRTLRQFLGEEHAEELRAAPGKFEAEPYYLPYFYESVLNGDGESIGDGEETEADILELSETERDAFGFAETVTHVAVSYSSQGFLSLLELSRSDYLKATEQTCDGCNANGENGYTCLCASIERGETIALTAPSFWASYLINGDASGFDIENTPEQPNAGTEEQARADAWLDSLADTVQPGGPVDCRDAGFIRRPDSGGLAADCQTYFFAAKRDAGLVSAVAV